MEHTHRVKPHKVNARVIVAVESGWVVTLSDGSREAWGDSEKPIIGDVFVTDENGRAAIFSPAEFTLAFEEI